MSASAWGGRLQDAVEAAIGAPPAEMDVVGEPVAEPLRELEALIEKQLTVDEWREDVVSGKMETSLREAAEAIDASGMLCPDESCQHVRVPTWWFKLSCWLFVRRSKWTK